MSATESNILFNGVNHLYRFLQILLKKKFNQFIQWIYFHLYLPYFSTNLEDIWTFLTNIAIAMKTLEVKDIFFEISTLFDKLFCCITLWKVELKIFPSPRFNIYPFISNKVCSTTLYFRAKARAKSHSQCEERIKTFWRWLMNIFVCATKRGSQFLKPSHDTPLST